MVVVLTVIAVVAGAVLASVNAVTAPQIEKINADNLAAGIKAVMGSDDIKVAEPEEVEGYTVYAIADAQGADLGKAIVTTNNGFGGPLKVLVGFDTEGSIKGYTVLEHAETPGLGAKAQEWFQDKIIGMNPGTSNFTVSKDGGEVDAITASTITSRAFLGAIQNAYDKVIAKTDGQSGATSQDKAQGKCGKCPKAQSKCEKCAAGEGQCEKCAAAEGPCDDCKAAGECANAEGDCCKNN